jgi:hypothetical protein
MGFLREGCRPCKSGPASQSNRYNDRPPAATLCSLLDDLEAVFLNDRVGQNFFGDAFELFLRFVAIPTIKIQDEKLPLTDVLDGFVAEAGQCVVDGLPLGIENRSFRHDPDMCLHGGSITLGKR